MEQKFNNKQGFNNPMQNENEQSFSTDEEFNKNNAIDNENNEGVTNEIQETNVPDNDLMLDLEEPKEEVEPLKLKVVAIQDGDTVTCINENFERIEIRLADIDAPENGQPYAVESKYTLKEILESNNNEIYVVPTTHYIGKNKLDKIVGNVYLSNPVENDLDQNYSVSNEMIKRGAAHYFTDYYGYEPENSFNYEKVQKQALLNSRGLWDQKKRRENPVDPKVWKERNNKMSSSQYSQEKRLIQKFAREKNIDISNTAMFEPLLLSDEIQIERPSNKEIRDIKIKNLAIAIKNIGRFLTGKKELDKIPLPDDYTLKVNESLIEKHKEEQKEKSIANQKKKNKKISSKMRRLRERKEASLKAEKKGNIENKIKTEKKKVAPIKSILYPNKRNVDTSSQLNNKDDYNGALFDNQINDQNNYNGVPFDNQINDQNNYNGSDFDSSMPVFDPNDVPSYDPDYMSRYDDDMSYFDHNDMQFNNFGNETLFDNNQNQDFDFDDNKINNLKKLREQSSELDNFSPASFDDDENERVNEIDNIFEQQKSNFKNTLNQENSQKEDDAKTRQANNRMKRN